MSLTGSISASIRFPLTLSAVLANLARQRRFLDENILPVIKEAKKLNDGSLADADFKKITHYYGLAVPAILGEAICLLHQRQMSKEERIASTALGAMTGLFDDFFDKQYMSADTIKSLLAETKIFSGSSNEKLFGLFFKQALQSVPGKDQMLGKLMIVYEAQVESKKQAGSGLTEDTIKDISFFKGGASVVFYRTAFLPAPSREEEAFLYNMGAIMQLCNDIFDVYKDRENGIRTVVTETKNIDNIRKLLQNELTRQLNEAKTTGFRAEQLKGCFAVFSLGIFSRAFVCLDQLERQQAITNNVFSVQLYSRKQLVCDMEKTINMLRSAKYHIRLMQLVRSY